VQVFVAVNVPSDNARAEDTILKQLCLQRQFNSEQFRHLLLNKPEQRRKLQTILGFKNQESSEPLRNVLRARELERSVSKISKSAIYSQYDLITTEPHWKAKIP